MTRTIGAVGALLLSCAASGADVESIVADMVADASSRSNLQLADASGYDGGFVIRGASDGHELRITGWTQIRYTFAHGEEVAGGEDDDEFGFSLRRTRLTAQGSLHDGAFGFKLTNSFSRASGAGRLSDAYVTMRVTDRVELRFGQFKLPFAREELNSAKRLLATDRSIVNDVFGQGRSKGVELGAEGERLRAWLAFSDGFNAANTNFDAAPADWALTGRVEWLGAGSWRAFRDFTSPRGSEGGAMIGVAASVEESPAAPGSAALMRASWTVDAGVEGDGWHFFIAAVGRHAEENTGTFHDLGVVAQASVYANDDIEPFVRFDVVLPDGDRPGDDAFRTLTLGANWYLHGHAVKLTVDGQWFFDDAARNDLVGPSSTQGLLAGARDGAFALRAQFQFVF